MYTVVLMAAMTTGTAAPDWHRHGGCHGYSAGCVGGCGGVYGGYNSNAGPAYGGTCIGTYGGYAVNGPNPLYGCWGCWGGNGNLTVYSGNGCYGYGNGVNGGAAISGLGISFQCHGCYGCYGGWSCYGSPTNVAPIEPLGGVPNPGGAAVSPTVPVIPAPTPLPKKEESRIRSKVIIEVPENAKLYVDDNLMTAGAGQRVFQTPPLNPGQNYFYDVRIEVTANGKTTTDSQRIVIRPGETVTASFREPGRPEVVTVRNDGQSK